MHERALGWADELRPAVVHVLAQRRCGLGNLAVDRKVDEIFELLAFEACADEAQP